MGIHHHQIQTQKTILLHRHHHLSSLNNILILLRCLLLHSLSSPRPIHSLVFMITHKLVSRVGFGASPMSKGTTPCTSSSQLKCLAVYVPPAAKKEAAQFLKKVSFNVPGLHVVDVDLPLDNLRNDDQKLENIALGREFHISLGRTVPIRVHQIDSMVTMLRQKLQYQKRYWIDFSKWEVFVNDDHTRTFLSMEVIAGGLSEITKQIQAVNDVYKLHNLPEFYKDPRPHISLAWAVGDVSALLQRVVGEETKKHPNVGGSTQKRIFTVKFGGIECRIGNKSYKICKLPDE